MTEAVSATPKKPGRPPQVAMTERPEFKAAVAEAAAMAVQAMMKHGVLPTQAATTAGGDEAATQLFRTMAMSIAEISDQGSNRKRVAPEILAEREAAHKRAVALIEDARSKVKKAREEGDEATISAYTPEYRVIAKIYFNERFVEPYVVDRATKEPRPVAVDWTGMPNDALVPLNDIAKRIFKEFRISVGMPEGLAVTDNRPVWVTQNGFVVKGMSGTAQRREIEVVQPFDAGFPEEMRIKRNDDPRAPEIRVLGSVAPPARQSTLGG